MYKHILFAWDLTKAGYEVAQRIGEMAKLMDARLSILHIVEPLKTYGYPVVTDASHDHIDFAKEALQKLAEELDVPEDRVHVKAGSTKQVILTAADDLDIDLIAVGSHGGSGFSRLLGSTANAITNSAECDVLTLRIDDALHGDTIHTFGDGVYSE